MKFDINEIVGDKQIIRVPSDNIIIEVIKNPLHFLVRFLTMYIIKNINPVIQIKNPIANIISKINPNINDINVI